jgi:hypothetical protein
MAQVGEEARSPGRWDFVEPFGTHIDSYARKWLRPRGRLTPDRLKNLVQAAGPAPKGSRTPTPGRCRSVLRV